MRLEFQETLNCDVLVIGSGGAGLRAAIAAKMSYADVLLVCKGRLGRTTNTYISKAIIATSGEGTPEDNKDVHADDTIKGGRFLCDPAKVALISERIVPEIGFLQECGVNFGMQKGRRHLVKIPGHRYARHVHGENWTGGDLVVPLIQRAEESGVSFKENLFITRLLAFDSNVNGATGVTAKGDFVVIRAKTVILATGGYAHIFLNTNNASGITGDGLALAYESGAALKDMEFVQFYPIAIGKRGNTLLLYEKLLAQNEVVLKNGAGEDIMRKNGILDPSRVTRDQLAQLIMKEIKDERTGKQEIIMDFGPLPEETAGELAQLMPAKWWKGQKRFGVAPTTHFCMGGIETDQWGETSLRGLFAVGEATAGAHGANRLGGNALAEVFSMGSLVGLKAAELAMKTASNPPAREDIDHEKNRLEGIFSKRGVTPEELIQDLKTLMWYNVGIVRERNELETALVRLQGPWPQAVIENPRDLIRLLEFKNMRFIAEVVCKAALQRTESRGSHYRIDYPKEDNEQWLKNILFRRGEVGMEMETRPAPRHGIEVDNTV